MTPKSLKHEAEQALSRANAPRKITLYYLLCMFGANFLLLAADLVIEPMLGSGLRAAQARNLYYAAYEVASIVLNIATIFWTVHYSSHYALDVLRGHETSFRSLLKPFRFAGRTFCVHFLEQFYTILWGVLFMLPGIMVLSYATMEYADILDPVLLAEALMQSPMYPVAMVLFAAAVIPTMLISYRYQFAQFLAKDLGLPAGSAIRASKYFMRGNLSKIIRLELSFWYYVLPILLPTAIFTLEMIGYTIIPEQYAVIYNVASNLYLFCIYLLWLPKYAVAHAAFYDAVTAEYRREREERTQPQLDRYHP